MPRRLAWISLAAIPLGAMAVGVQACALIAGLQDHTLETPGAGGGGGAGGASTTGSAGGGAMVRGWPDSPTAYCTTGAAKVPCPTVAMAPAHGQDGDLRINVPAYVTTEKLVTDPVT